MIRILITDNNVELCETLREFLNSQPDMHVVGLAYDGEQALRDIPALQPDVVILDITMPHLDGLAVLERLEGLNLSRQPRVIVLTALAREDVIQRFTDLGAHYFIIKPFDLDLLAERIRQFGREGALMAREVREGPRPQPAIELESQVTELLHEMGVPPHFKGYTYLREAVLLVLQEEGMLGGALTKRLYPRLAEKYETTAGGVEAAIRNAMIACWENGNREFLAELAGHAVNARKGRFPTNSMIIARLADKVRLAQRRAG